MNTFQYRQLSGLAGVCDTTLMLPFVARTASRRSITRHIGLTKLGFASELSNSSLLTRLDQANAKSLDEEIFTNVINA